MRTALLVVVVASAIAQTTAQSFTGTWTAELTGQAYARLELNATNDGITGQLTLGAVHFGRDGAVEAVLRTVQDATPTPVFDVAVRNGLLYFARRDEDTVDRFELRLVNGQGKLTILLSPEMRAELSDQGVLAVQPFVLRRLSTR